MNRRDHQPQQGTERLGASVIKALGLHLLVLIFLFVSFSSAPEFEPAKPIVQATLVQLDSKSPATTQTDQKIAGEAERTAAQRHEAEELERQQQEQQQEQEATQRAAAEEARQAAAATAAEQKAAEQRKQAEQAEKQKAEEAKRKADAAKKLAEDEAAKEEAAKKAAAEAAKRKEADEVKRKEAEAAKRKAEDDAKRKATEEAAKKKAEADRVAKLKRDQEEAKAKALADLLASETQYQQAQADQVGDEVAASFDDVIRRYVSEQWRRPPTARNGMVVEVRISMLPTGQITDVVVTRSSGDPGFDQSATQAVRNVGRIPEMQQLSRDNPATFDRLYRQRTLRFKPEDLAF